MTKPSRFLILLAVAVLPLTGFSCRSSSGGGDYYSALGWAGTWSHGVNPDPAVAASAPLLVSITIPPTNRATSGDRYAQAALAVADWPKATGGRVALVLLPAGDPRTPDIVIADGVPIQKTDPPSGWTEGGGVPSPPDPNLKQPPPPFQRVSLSPGVVCKINTVIEPLRVRGTVTHEIGHALGIGGHSPDENDVMCSRAFPAPISGRDLRTLAKVYGVPML